MGVQDSRLSKNVAVGWLSCVLVPVVLPICWAAVGLVCLAGSCWVFGVSAPPGWAVGPPVLAHVAGSGFCWAF